jgi:phosphoribosyl 1,2-cyclic phosphodiesterase
MAPPKPKFELIFLGTGVSTGVPKIGCILRKSEEECTVCHRAYKNPLDPNHRCNVSVLVRKTDSNGESLNIMIDAGKTMRDAVLRWLPRYNVKGIDAVILTHGHADAVGGIDDLRDLQIFQYNKDESGKIAEFKIAKELPIYLNQATFETCKGAYPYLVKEIPKDDKCPRRIASLRWEVIENSVPFHIEGVKVIPLPVLHGGDYICLGFAFGEGNFVYLSDISGVQPHVLKQLKGYDIEILVLDALAHFHNPSHFSLEQSIEFVKKLRPERTLLVGMSCDMGLHDEVNKDLEALEESEGLRIQLAHDGLGVNLNF